jgi:alpha-galactosidase
MTTTARGDTLAGAPAVGVDLSGRALAVAGVQAPVLFPERLVLISAMRQ